MGNPFDKLYRAALLTALILFAVRAMAQESKPAEPPPAPPPPATGAPPQPQMRAVLEELQTINPTPIEMLDVGAARRQPTIFDAVTELKKKRRLPLEPQPVAGVDDRKIVDPDQRNIPVRVYTPGGKGPFPVIVYYHGGGFVLGNLDTYDATCRALANGAGAVVMSVEYRLAPENKYPAAIDDAFGAYRWARAHAGEIKGDPTRVAVAGEGAGGNLAAVVCLMAKETGAPPPTFQLLIYPITDHHMGNESYAENANAKPLNKAMMSWFLNHYTDMGQPDSPRVFPMRAKDVSGLPPAMVITAQIDPLRTEGQAYARKLKDAGVPVEHRHYDGVTHQFFSMAAVLDDARAAQGEAFAVLKKAFGTDQPATTQATAPSP